MSEDEDLVEILVEDEAVDETAAELMGPDEEGLIAPSMAPPPPGYEDTDLKWMKWGPVLVAFGPGIAPHYLQDLSWRRRENLGIVVVIYGPPGSGKTYFGLSTALILDEEFDVEKQVLFSREQIMGIISKRIKVKPGQALIVDESQFSISARTWGNTRQVELMQHLAALRSRNFVLIIVVLNPEMLDKIMREFQITHKVFMKRRGVAQVQIMKQGSRYSYLENLSKDCELPLPDSWPECEEDMKKDPPSGCLNPSCLRCHDCGLVDGLWEKRDKWPEIGFKPCMRTRAIYERMKSSFLESEADKAIENDKPQEKLTDDARRLAITAKIDSIPLTDKNHLSVEAMRDAVEAETGTRPSEKETMRDRVWYETTFPAMIQKKRDDKKAAKKAAQEVKAD